MSAPFVKCQRDSEAAGEIRLNLLHRQLRYHQLVELNPRDDSADSGDQERHSLTGQ